MAWDVHHIHMTPPGVLMPGLILSKLGLERYVPDIPGPNPPIDRSIVINGTDYGAPSTVEQLNAYYIAVLQALNSGQPIYWEREVEALAGRLTYMGDIHRFFVKNLTSEPIAMPIGWTHESVYGPYYFTGEGFLWVELGRHPEGGGDRETAIQFGPSDPAMFSWEGVLYIPPGEWDLNSCISCRTIWEGGTAWNGISRSTLWMPQTSPDDSQSHLRRRRAAWQDFDRLPFR